MIYKLINKINPKYSVVQTLLTNRGIPIDEVNHYLNSSAADIQSYMELGEGLLKAAAATIIKAIKNDAPACVVVDADCDGYTSAAILMNYLYDLFPSWVQNKLDFYLHDEKQHGLNDCVDFMLEKGFKLILIPDAGSNDIEECKLLHDNGVDIVILDHHLIEKENPYAIVINNQYGSYKNKQFSGAGVVWQFCRYIDNLMNVHFANDYLDLAALGNCADMMSLTSIETKELIREGFQRENVKNPFFEYMVQKNEFSMKSIINPTTVAFYVAPFVNAMTRSGTLEEKKITFLSMLKYKAFKMILSNKRGHKLGEEEKLVMQAIRTVTNVKARQTKRQNEGLEIIENMIKDNNLLDHKVLLFLMEPGIIDKNIAGLIANKMMAKYQRPSCILTRGEDGYKGSARGCTLAGVPDFKAVCEQTGLIQFAIGHENAFGLGIDEKNIDAFIKKTDELLSFVKQDAIYYVDYIYSGVNVEPQDILDIANLQDLWGQDLSEPLICVKGLKVTKDMVVVYAKKTNTLKITLPNNISLIKFNASDEECDRLQNQGEGYLELDIIGKASANEWNGNVTPQILIEDYQIVDSSKYYF